MNIRFAAGYIVEPARLDPAAGPRAEGSEFEAPDALVHRVERLFAEEIKSRIRVHFAASRQQNDVRDLVLRLARRRDAAAALELARRLSAAMDRRSARSLLLVLVEALEKDEIAVHVLKFPHDESLGADLRDGKLFVRVLDRAFTAESAHFKAATFSDDPRAKTAYWKGVVEDRQAKLAGGQVSDYWIKGFLNAELVVTKEQGTDALADALKALFATATAKDATALGNAAQLLPQLAGRRVSFRDVANNYVPAELRQAFLKRVESEYAFEPDTVFELDGDRFETRFGFRVLMLENRVSVSAPAANFGQLVRVTPRGEEVDVRTSGRYVGTRIRSRAG